MEGLIFAAPFAGFISLVFAALGALALYCGLPHKGKPWKAS